MTKNPTQDKALTRFAENIDMEAFRMICEDSSNEKLSTLIVMMADPAYALCSFQKLTREAHLTLQELQVAYSDGMRHIGLLRMATHLPDVMEDVALDAKNSLKVCPRCDGYKVVPGPENTTRDCPVCRGTGEVKRMGDKHARDLVFESAKLTKQSGPMVQINQAFAGSDSRMETMLKRTRAIVLDDSRRESIRESSDKKPLDNPPQSD